MKINNLTLRTLVAVFFLSTLVAVTLYGDDDQLKHEFKNTIYNFDSVNKITSCLMNTEDLPGYPVPRIAQIACRNQEGINKETKKYNFEELNMYVEGCGYFALRNIERLYNMLQKSPSEYPALIKSFYDVDDHYIYFNEYFKILQEKQGPIKELHRALDANRLVTIIDNLPQGFQPFITRENISLAEEEAGQKQIINPLSIRGDVLGNLYKKINSPQPFFHGILFAVKRDFSSHGADHLVGLLIHRDKEKNVNYYILNSLNSTSHESSIKQFIYRHLFHMAPLKSYRGINEYFHDFTNEINALYIRTKFINR